MPITLTGFDDPRVLEFKDLVLRICRDVGAPEVDAPAALLGYARCTDLDILEIMQSMERTFGRDACAKWLSEVQRELQIWNALKPAIRH